AEDSYNLLPALLGEVPTGKMIRPDTLHQTISLALAIRSGPWKYLDHKGSGGNDYGREHLKPFVLKEMAPTAGGQLYHLVDDPGETTNLALKYPARVKEMKTRLEEYKSSGRSVPKRK
ncbi:MAG: arylsulfatase, partial [Planctomycetaceae bacterium]|nr:arylsulfatase [Planctomycetaceae bacterium]